MDKDQDCVPGSGELTKNKLYTLSYFRKRLHDVGISSRILIKDYSPDDKRYWTISVFDDMKILCTCFKEGKECSFEFWDGGNVLMQKNTIRTQSMNVIISFLMKCKW